MKINPKNYIWQFVTLKVGRVMLGRVLKNLLEEQKIAYVFINCSMVQGR